MSTPALFGNSNRRNLVFCFTQKTEVITLAILSNIENYELQTQVKTHYQSIFAVKINAEVTILKTYFSTNTGSHMPYELFAMINEHRGSFLTKSQQKNIYEYASNLAAIQKLETKLCSSISGESEKDIHPV